MLSIKSVVSYLFLAVLFTLLIFASLPGTSISAGGSTSKKLKQQKNPLASAEIVITIIPSANHTFGYNILFYGKPFVHQPNIPGLPGKEGFATMEKAQTVAEFVVKKIENNEIVPTVSIEDLINLGVLKPQFDW